MSGPLQNARDGTGQKQETDVKLYPAYKTLVQFLALNF
jgi:hypothetical protein